MYDVSGQNLRVYTPEGNDPVIGATSATNQAVTSEACLPDLLGEQARTQPDNTAASFHGKDLTYRQLNEASRGIARYLRHINATSDSCVGMYLEPSLDLMIATWGILYSGCAYLPLAPEYPADRLRYMIADCHAKVIITQPDLTASLAELAPQGTIVVTLSDALEVARSLPARPDADAGTSTGPAPCDLAYVIYTSGSTGQPKGVLIEHRSIVSQLRWLRSRYGLGPGTTVLQKTPMSFDAAQWEILAPGCGSKVVIAGPGVYRDPERLIDSITRHDVTMVQCVPTLLQALLDSGRLPDCKSLTQIFCGGEVLTRDLAATCLETLPECELVNLYGPTEATINSSAFTVDRQALAAARPRSRSARRWTARATTYSTTTARRSPEARPASSTSAGCSSRADTRAGRS